MSLKLRRGLSTDRTTVTPAEGELLYTTDTKLVYVGDGSTAGGNVISGGGGGSGIGNIVEDTSPQLGGNLDINGYSIVSTSNQDIIIDANGTGNVLLQNSLEINSAGNILKTGELNITPSTLLTIGRNSDLIDGNVYISRNSYSATFGQGFTFAQHHATPDTVNFTFYRTRGTGVSPAAVQNGDKLADISFAGHDGTNSASGAAIAAIVEGSPTTGNIPTKIIFATNNGTLTSAKAEISSAGVWKVNSIQNYSGSSLTLTATTINVAGNMQLNAQSDLRFADSDSSNWVAFQAPSTVASNVTWTLPSTDGGSGQVLSTNGSGVLSWATVSSGSGLTSRSTASATTASIADGAIDNISITGFTGYILYKVEVDGAAWVRIYTDEASRTADASRVEGVDPLPGAGVITEVITTGSQTILISPGAFGFNNESVPTTAIPIAVTNKTGSTTTITVTLTIVQLEA